MEASDWDKDPATGGKLKGRLLAVGDIHGRLELLRALMGRTGPTPEDRLVFLGDYVDRGPDSPGVLDYLLAFEQRFPETIFLKGNHEAMLLNYLEGQNRLLYILNGGQATLAAYERRGLFGVPPEHLDFLRRLQLYYETDEFIFVHAGLRPGFDPAGQSQQDLLWIREEFQESDYDWGKTVVFGHTPQPHPLFAPGRIGLDTGAGHGRGLTCCEVRSRKCWTVS